MEFFQGIGGGPGTVGCRPGRVRFIDELPERQAVVAQAVQGVTAVRHIAQHLLTSLACLVGQQSAHLAECDPAATPETRVIRSNAGGLHAQCEARESAVVNLKRLCGGLSHLARQELRPNEGSHVYLLRIDAIR
jgi:hypothetical protein